MRTLYKKFIGNKTNLIWSFVLIAFFMLVILFKAFVIKNNLTHFCIMEYVVNGERKVKRDPGHYWKGINKVYSWKWANAMWFSTFDDEGSTSDDAVPLMYSDGAKGSVSGIMVYSFDYKTPDSTFIRYQDDYNNQDNFEDRIIRPMNTDALKISSALLTTEESYTTKKKEYGQRALDQLVNGIYRTQVVRDTLMDFTGEKIVGDVTRIINGPNGYERSKERSLSSLNIKVPVFSLYEIDYADLVDSMITKNRTLQMDQIISNANTKLENRKNIEADKMGQVNIIDQKYNQEVSNMLNVIKAETSRDTTKIVAETRVQVSKIKGVIAKTKKDIALTEGTKELTIRNLGIHADNQFQDRLDKYAAIEIRKADAFAKAKGIFPRYMLSGGGQTGAWDMLLYNEGKRAVGNSAVGSSEK
jgi:hypothetical protein